MDLILWRHAEAFDLRELSDDLDRALTPKGERHAQRMGEWLNRQLPAGTRVLVSPARRTQQTAAALDRRTKTVPALAPDGTVEGLLAAARWPEAREPVLVRNLLVAVLAIVATLIPDLDVGTIEGVVMGALALLAGASGRAKVTPIADPRL